MSLFANYQRQANSIAQGRMQTAEQLAQTRGSMYAASAAAAAQTLTEGETGSEINLGKKMASKFVVKGGLTATLEGAKLVADNSNRISNFLTGKSAEPTPGTSEPSAEINTETYSAEDIENLRQGARPDDVDFPTFETAPDPIAATGEAPSEAVDGFNQLRTAALEYRSSLQRYVDDPLEVAGGDDSLGIGSKPTTSMSTQTEPISTQTEPIVDAGEDAAKSAAKSGSDAAAEAAEAAADAARQAGTTAAEDAAKAGAKAATDTALEAGGEAAAGTIGAAVGGALSTAIPIIGWGVGLYSLISGGMDIAKEIRDDPEAKAQKLVNQANTKVAAAESQVSSDEFQSRIGAQAPSFGSLAAAGARAQQSIALHD